MITRAEIQVVSVALTLWAATQVSTQAADPERVFTGFKGVVVALAYAPKGDLLAVADESSQIQILDATRGTVRSRFEYYETPGSRLAWSPDGQRLYWLGNNAWVVSDVEGKNRREVRCSFHGCRQIALSPDGQTVAVAGSGTVGLWRAADGQALGEAEVHPNWRISHLAFSQRSPRLFTACDDRQPLWLDLPGLSPRSPGFPEQAAKPVALEAHPTMEAVVLLNRDALLHRFDLSSMQDRPLKISSPEVHTLAISPDGRWVGLAGGTEANFFAWDSGEHRRLKISNTALGFRSLTFTPDSGTVALGDHDSQVRVWKVNALDVVK